MSTLLTNHINAPRRQMTPAWTRKNQYSLLEQNLLSLAISVAFLIALVFLTESKSRLMTKGVNSGHGSYFRKTLIISLGLCGSQWRGGWVSVLFVYIIKFFTFYICCDWRCIAPCCSGTVNAADQVGLPGFNNVVYEVRRLFYVIYLGKILSASRPSLP